MNKVLMTKANPLNGYFKLHTLPEPRRLEQLPPRDVQLNEHFVSEQLFQTPIEEKPSKLKLPTLKKKVNMKKRKPNTIPNRVGFNVTFQSEQITEPVRLSRSELQRPAHLSTSMPGLYKPGLLSHKRHRSLAQLVNQRKNDEKTNSNIYFWYFNAGRESKTPRKKPPNHVQPLKLPMISEPTAPNLYVPEPSLASEHSAKAQAASSYNETATQRGSIVDMMTNFVASRRNSVMEDAAHSISRRNSNATVDTLRSNAPKTQPISNDVEDYLNEVDEENEENFGKFSRASSEEDDLFDGFPIMGVSLRNSKPLTTREMKDLPLSEKFYKEAGKMIYEPKTAAFIPKGVNAYLAKMRKKQAKETKKLEDIWYPNLT